jgi:hypothetical protein
MRKPPHFYLLGRLYSYMPSYGVYLDTTVDSNAVTQNECVDAAKTATHNIGNVDEQRVQTQARTGYGIITAGA